jgi:hypothetical protein
VGRFRRDARSAVSAKLQLQSTERELLNAALLLAAFSQLRFRAQLFRSAKLLRSADLFGTEPQLPVVATFLLAAKPRIQRWRWK